MSAWIEEYIIVSKRAYIILTVSEGAYIIILTVRVRVLSQLQTCVRVTVIIAIS